MPANGHPCLVPAWWPGAIPAARPGGPRQGPVDWWKPLCHQLWDPGEGDLDSSSQNRGGAPCLGSPLAGILQRPARPLRRRGAGPLHFSLSNPGNSLPARTLVTGLWARSSGDASSRPASSRPTSRMGKGHGSPRPWGYPGSASFVARARRERPGASRGQPQPLPGSPALPPGPGAPTPGGLPCTHPELTNLGVSDPASFPTPVALPLPASAPSRGVAGLKSLSTVAFANRSPTNTDLSPSPRRTGGLSGA